MTPDYKLIFKYKEDKKDTVSFLFNNEILDVPIDIKEGCGTLIENISETIQIKNEKNALNNLSLHSIKLYLIYLA